MASQEFVLLPEDRAPSEPTGPDQDVPVVLLVESPGSDTERYRALAKRAGFKIVTAHSGPMTRVMSQRTRPDLVLLGPVVGPPGPSELARRIKEDPDTADIPVMILVDADQTDPDLSLVYPTEASAFTNASDDEIVQTMRAVRRSSSRARARRPSCPLEGDLADDNLPGVLEFLFTTQRTGRIVVLNGSKSRGAIYIDDGNVVHAELARDAGEAAFRELCFQTRGRFKFEPEFRPAEATMRDNGMAMLLESARARDEAQRGTTGSRRRDARAAS